MKGATPGPPAPRGSAWARAARVTSRVGLCRARPRVSRSRGRGDGGGRRELRGRPTLLLAAVRVPAGAVGKGRGVVRRLPRRAGSPVGRTFPPEEKDDLSPIAAVGAAAPARRRFSRRGVEARRGGRRRITSSRRSSTVAPGAQRVPCWPPAAPLRRASSAAWYACRTRRGSYGPPFARDPEAPFGDVRHSIAVIPYGFSRPRKPRARLVHRSPRGNRRRAVRAVSTRGCSG